MINSEGLMILMGDRVEVVTEGLKGTVTRVWTKPFSDPYITITTDSGSRYVRFASLVSLVPPAWDAESSVTHGSDGSSPDVLIGEDEDGNRLIGMAEPARVHLSTADLLRSRPYGV
jgi:hypothetical protein